DRAGAEAATVRPGPATKDCASPRGELPRLELGRPAFSPDGRQILVAVNCWEDSGAYNFPATVYEISVDGSSNRAVEGFTTNLRRHTDLAFSEDGLNVDQTETGGARLCPVITG